ncbi:MAG: UDP-N-acetylmuramoyl-tripeptide--D-alanyl-D-alanine ligase [Bacteroidales bacterium]
MTPILTLYELLQAGAGISTDSRTPEPGSLFFALKGENFDGNKFAPAALQNGCRLAVVDDPAYAGRENYLVVEDVLSTLQQLGSYHRMQLNFPVIGITGSNGKTTTKELLHRVLSRMYRTSATKGNLNNHIGVPLTLLSFKPSLEMAIVEMGANHVGEIAALSHLAKPDYGIITNIGKAHLEGFGSLENIAKAKGELYDHVRHHKGTLFVNHNQAVLAAMAEGVDSVHYGYSDDLHCTGIVQQSSPFVEMHFHTNKDFGQATAGMQGNIRSQLTGAYNAENILAAITIGLYFGVPVDDIEAAVADYQPTNNRSQMLQTPHNSIIMDAYNANPTSMAAAIENFSLFTDLPKVAILGDMLEMGADACKEHEAIARLAFEQGFKQVIFVGPQFREVANVNPQGRHFADVDEAATWLKENPLKGNRVLIKGSRGIQLEKLVNYL